MHTFEALLALIGLCVALAAIAQRIRVPSAVLLVVGGMAVALVPWIPEVEIEPALIMALLLPPLLQVSAYNTDWPGFKSSLGSILLLAIGGVVFTAAAVAVIAHELMPEMTWFAAIALGAIVAPPDAVAATSVLKRFKLPKRIVTVLEGESLLNDASSLVLYRFAVVSVTAGATHPGIGLLQFFAVAVGGAVIGWLVGHLAIWLFDKIDDSMLEVALSILSGYAAYLIAESVHASGVLGAVICGLVLGRKQHAKFSAQTRLQGNAVWSFIEFLAASLAFVLIGLQLRGIWGRLAEVGLSVVMSLLVCVPLTLIVSRVIWMYGTVYLPRIASSRLRDEDPGPPWTHAAVMSWAGMRGVVSIAAALALPKDFPQRDVILMVAFIAIFVTLVLQGTTLGYVITRLGVEEPESRPAEEAIAVRADLAAAARDAVKARMADSEDAGASAVIGEFEDKALHAQSGDAAPDDHLAKHDAIQEVRLQALDASRAVLAERTDDIDAEVHRALVEELDLEEQRLRAKHSDPNR